MTRQTDACERQALTQPEAQYAAAKMSTEGNSIRACFAKTETASKFLPKCEIHDSGAQKICTVNGALDFTPAQRSSEDLLKDKTASPEDRLKAAQELAKQGITEVKASGADGRDMTLKIGTIKAGDNQMLHVSMQDGKHSGILLKGVADSSGAIHHQKDHRGHEADFYGSAAKHYEENFKPSTAEKRSAQDDTKAVTTTPDRADSHKLETKAETIPESKPAADVPRTDLYNHYRNLEDARVANLGIQADKPNRSNNPTMNAIMDEAARQGSGHGRKAITDTDHGVYFRGRFAIDADGSPRARQIDKFGDPHTALRYDDRKRSSVNSEEVPFIAMPRGEFTRHGLKPGDMAIVRNRENGKMAVAVFADVGPHNKRGEGSMALATELGLSNNPNYGGSEKRNFDYLVLPKTGYPAQNQEQLMARIQAMRDRLGLN
jgi:Fungal chitosanase of glycosyl hydrolase group 75